MKLKYFALSIMLCALTSCEKFDYTSYEYDVLDIAAMSAGCVILLFFLIALTRPLRINLKSYFFIFLRWLKGKLIKKKIDSEITKSKPQGESSDLNDVGKVDIPDLDELATKQNEKREENPEENIKSRIVETSQFDDFYPIPRRFKIDLEARNEDTFHTKLNYHNIIEKLTRKLYFLFLTIITLTLSFSYVLYKTSVSERITPKEPVMDAYEEMMGRIMSVEDRLEQAQINRVNEIDSLSSSVRDSIKANILMKTVEYEDELIAEVNSNFFKIYYWRYILVRFLVSFIVLGLIRYLMVLYMRIRADRNDLIRKEEALSILFYVLEDMQKTGTTGKDKSLFGKTLKDKIPNFPLRTLFDSPDSKRGKNDVSPQMLSVIEDLLDAQTRSTQAIEKLAEKIK